MTGPFRGGDQVKSRTGMLDGSDGLTDGDESEVEIEVDGDGGG